jgi:hypothetical protein
MANAPAGSILLVVHDFIARSADELSLAKGDRIELIERDDDFGDGWFLGRHMNNGNTGLFPEGKHMHCIVNNALQGKLRYLQPTSLHYTCAKGHSVECRQQWRETCNRELVATNDQLRHYSINTAAPIFRSCLPAIVQC